MPSLLALSYLAAWLWILKILASFAKACLMCNLRFLLSWTFVSDSMLVYKTLKWCLYICQYWRQGNIGPHKFWFYIHSTRTMTCMFYGWPTISSLIDSRLVMAKQLIFLTKSQCSCLRYQTSPPMLDSRILLSFYTCLHIHVFDLK